MAEYGEGEDWFDCLDPQTYDFMTALPANMAPEIVAN
jgi:hypothetical protein